VEATINSDALSPIGLFLQSGAVGRAVMLVLALASLWTWAIIIEAIYGAMRLRRALRQGDASPAFVHIVGKGRAANAAFIDGETVSERRRRVLEAMGRAVSELLTRAEGGLSNLAVVASVAPFIGLFGTVWGIMSSFAGIADAKDTSLAVVAPGISEALAATAYGLAAAIPASIGYNRIGAAFRRVGRDYAARLQDLATEILATPADRRDGV
jgi:biopolymer transport protein ExbB/TolQ